MRGLVSLGAAGALFLGNAGLAHAATITVNTGSDSYGQHDTHCSLRDAVQAVDNQAAFGACPAGTGHDTIVLPGRPYALSIPPSGLDDNSTGDLNIDRSVAISGPGTATHIDAGKIDRIFDIASSATVTISGVTLENGQALAGAAGTDSSSSPTNGSPGSDGGAILNAGSLTLNHVIVRDSVAGAGGRGGNNTGGGFTGPTGSGGSGGNGGAIASTGSLTLDTVTLSDNQSGPGGSGGGGVFPPGTAGTPGNGGAISAAGPVVIRGATFWHNAAVSGAGGPPGGAGGAISAGPGRLTVSKASFTANASGNGSQFLAGGTGGGPGGAISTSGPATVSQSTFSKNLTGTGAPMGFSPAPSGSGGAISSTSTLTIVHDHFSHNSTGAGESPGGSGTGGAIQAAGALTVRASTFTSNTTGSGAQNSLAPSGAGGAIFTSVPAHITTSTFTGNATGSGASQTGSGSSGSSSGNGGAIASDGGRLTLSASTLDGNKIGAPGTGTSSGGAPGLGAAVYVNNGSTSTLVNDTLTGNAGQGAITVTAYFTGNTTATLQAVTDAGNQEADGVARQGSATVSLSDTLLSGNGPANCDGTIGDGGHNLSFPTTDASCPSTFSHGNPRLAHDLAANGGPTKTLALHRGSAAIDGGPAKPGPGCPATDQRGMPRPQRKACDIGAFEFALPTIIIVRPTAGAKYKQGQVVKAAYHCSEGGRRRFIASCHGPVPSGKPISTGSTGKHTFRVAATDQAGARSVRKVSYTVIARR